MSSDSFVRFPGTACRSAEEFKRFRADSRDVFDERYRREQALGVADAKLTLGGFCGPCLQVTEFTSPTHGGDATADGRWVPQWRLAQHCGCRFALTSHERALLHMALPRLGPPSWSRGGLLGRADRLAAYLAERGFDYALWPRLARDATGTLALPDRAGGLHMVLAADEVAHLPALDETFAAIARSLAPGGCFLFTTPFDVEAEASTTNPEIAALPPTDRPLFSTDPVHRLGWDLIPRLRDAGFDDAAGYCYWSEELGYLGPYNMIFLAFR